ncbi:hypothetical protein BELL_0068g00300 [Botrytis elliptica]|uniref:SET domain-containing protein n=1 Tax=Botrytis elliptica TaxID=278938 RepID=A0A4Z1KAZ8_9HELO|nr:hypothetical protein EAE99_004488 [Botrytis elliptica]TGO78403.1 hypothetical protein BELL_0068g00300 [Botrytis elliptica]
MANWFGWAPWAKPRGRQPRPRPVDRDSQLSSDSRSRSRSRSSSRPPRRRAKELNPAERLAREKKGEREKEMEAEKIRFMEPAARIAYSEQKKVQHENRIKKLKGKFASRKKKLAEKHQEKVMEENRGWKRKHEDDAVVQAAMRRRTFLENRGKKVPVSQSMTTNFERERNKIHTTALFEKIYADLQYHFLHPTLINSDTYDPYEGLFDDLAGVYLRFLFLAQNPEDHARGIGIDSACVLMLSQNFRTALTYGELPDGTFAKQGQEGYSQTTRWDEFLLKLQLEHFSIRGFAIARHIPYMKVFARSGLFMFEGDVRPANLNLQLDPSIRDPFEVCLGGDGTVYPCLFTPLPGEFESVHQGVFKLPFKTPKENVEKLGPAKNRVVPLRFQNLKANVFNREIFKQYDPPSTWPPSWEYPPADIQHPCREWGKNYPLCVACGLRTGPLEVVEEKVQEEPEDSENAEESEESDAAKAPEKESICRCKTIDVFNRILVEIKEYHSESTSKVADSVDRGVRILQKVPRGHIISEVLGEFIPLGAESDFKCPSTFSVDFHAPPAVDKSGKVLEIDPDVVVKKTIDTNTEPIATLITGHKGGWTRVINKGTSQISNVEFRSEVWAGKLRITVRALRDINFGEQLFVRWGDSYLEPDGQTLHAKKKDQDERLPMRALSGFYK